MPPSSRSRVLRAVLLVIVVVLVVGLVVTSASALLLVRRPLPATGGEATLEGLSAEVQVSRDARGVPQIYADDAGDLFRAQGYVHAQDRFFQMDYQRHVTSGRLAEMVGPDPDAVASDAVARTLGWRRVAQAEVGLLSPEARAALEAYADGVNAYISTREASRLGVEYSVLGLTRDLADVEPWTPVDSLTWLKAVAWEMRADDGAEVERAAVYDLTGDAARTEQLFPPYPEGLNPTVLPAGTTGATQPSVRVTLQSDSTPETPFLALGGGSGLAALRSAGQNLGVLPDLLGADGAGEANSWVVSGTLTEGGSPLLAVDPHVAVAAPAPWYQAGLHCREVGTDCPYDVAGIGFAGVPGVFMGHNGDLAWGLSALGADVSDMFVERTPLGDAYLVDGRRTALERRTETIEVNGGPEVRFTVRSTAHGPIVSDPLPTLPNGDESDGATTPDLTTDLGGFAAAIGWTGFTAGRTFDGLLALNRATDAADVAAAAAELTAPAQSIVFSTADGEIGYQAAGAVPRRAEVIGWPLPTDGSWPRPGWDSRYDWLGTVDPATLPAAVDPEQGYVVAANQAVLPAGQGPQLTDDWDAGYRAALISEAIDAAVAAGTPLTVEALGAMQSDATSPYAAILVPALLEVDVEDAFVEQGVDLLRDWDYTQASDSAAAAYFAAVWDNVLRLTFWDDVPEAYRPDGGSRWLEVLRGLLADPQSPWWDDRTTINVVETRDEVLRQALNHARLQLTSAIGKDPTRWEWGTMHQAAPQHPLFGREDAPGLVGALMNPRPLAVDGGTSIVLATAWGAQEWDGDFPVFDVSTMPSARLVTDLGDLDASTWVNAAGNSGHPGSAHYTDQFAAWADGETFPWPFSADAVGAAASSTLRLVPGE